MPFVARPGQIAQAAVGVALALDWKQSVVLQTETAQRALVDDENRVACDDKVLALVGRAPKGVPRRLRTGLMEQRRDAVAPEIQQAKRHERRHAVVPVAVGAAIENKQSAVGSYRRHRADALATGDPEHGRSHGFFAGPGIQHKKAARLGMVVEIVNDGFLFFFPKLQVPARLFAFRPGIHCVPIAVVHTRVLGEQMPVTRDALSHGDDRIRANDDVSAPAGLDDDRVIVARCLAGKLRRCPKQLAGPGIESPDAQILRRDEHATLGHRSGLANRRRHGLAP